MISQHYTPVIISENDPSSVHVHQHHDSCQLCFTCRSLGLLVCFWLVQVNGGGDLVSEVTPDPNPAAAAENGVNHDRVSPKPSVVSQQTPSSGVWPASSSRCITGCPPENQHLIVSLCVSGSVKPVARPEDVVQSVLTGTEFDLISGETDACVQWFRWSDHQRRMLIQV